VKKHWKNPNHSLDHPIFSTYYPKHNQRFPNYSSLVLTGSENKLNIDALGDFTMTTALSSHFSPLTLDLTAEEIRTAPLSATERALSSLLRCTNTMAFRIAIPPLAIWAMLYSVVEYLI
jgi:hypothetical protein